MHVSFRVSRSVMTHIIEPGGLCKLAVPDGGELPAESLISTLRSDALCSSVNVSPAFFTVATPVKMVPLQHQRYSPVIVLNKTVLAQPAESSCNLALNTLTVKLQVAVLPEASVAVQVTVVTPTGKQLPEGGLQTTTTPGQLSLAVVVKLTTTQGSLTLAVTAVTLAGQVITGGCVSFTVMVNVQVDVGNPVTVQVTVVVPTGKNEPDGGLQVAVNVPGQLSVTVGAG